MVGDPGRHVVEGAAVHADDAFVGTKLLDIGLRVAKDRLEPFVLAKPRAFSLKSSFLTSIIKKCMGEDVFEDFEPAEIKPGQPGICQLILGDLYPWYGRTESQLQTRFPDVKNPKSKYADYVSRMLGLKDLENTEEFQKANIHIKTIRVEEDGTIEQHMSFGAFDFCDVASTKWEDSDWYAYFAGARFLFAVFKMKDGEYVFDRALFYSLPEIVTEGFIKYTYESLYEYNQCRLYGGGKFDKLHGQDETILPSLAQGGAQGGIGGTTNYNGRELVGIIEAWQKGDLETAREKQNFAQAVINVICHYRGNIVAGKRIMKLIGFDLGPNRVPFQNMTDQEEAAMKQELEAIGFFGRCNRF